MPPDLDRPELSHDVVRGLDLEVLNFQGTHRMDFNWIHLLIWENVDGILLIWDPWVVACESRGQAFVVLN
eukprot:373700-Pelagomonas_calceolata.AAC.4